MSSVTTICWVVMSSKKWFLAALWTNCCNSSKLLENVAADVERIELVRLDVASGKNAVKTISLSSSKVIALLHDLLHDLGIVISIFGVVTSSNFFSLGQKGSASTLLREGLGEFVQISNTTGSLVKGTTSKSLSTSLLIDKLDEISLGTTRVVVLAILVGLREPLESRETSNVVARRNCAVLVSVHLSNDNVLFVLVGGANLLVGWSQGLAMTTPGGEKLNKHILALIHYNTVKVGLIKFNDVRSLLLDAAIEATLLVDESNKIFSATTARILLGRGGALGEVLERGEATHAKARAKITVLISIDLCNDSISDVREGVADLLVSWSHRLAVSAPGSVELDKDETVAIDNVVERPGVELNNVGSDSSEESRGEEEAEGPHLDRWG
eukprot:m.184954 g.184954  ORF g.184954 m.184954 type:complete len:384 (-) comp16677_c6_seq3:27-1178(-)